jgi:5-(carboxyamino)imidazole ribonucleotide mutase
VPHVAIIYGSPNDAAKVSKAGDTLRQFGVDYEEVSISAHRAPRTLVSWIEGLEQRGVRVVIAAAGLSAALPGVVAAHTVLPVIGLPLPGGAVDGLDSLLSIAQMPPGVAVATVGLGNATNAAVLAVQMLALADDDLRGKLRDYKQNFEESAQQRLESAGTAQ